MRDNIVPGAVLPDYDFRPRREAPKARNFKSQTRWFLFLSRGGFCPKERRQHEGLVQLHLELEVAYCGLITITIDNIIETN